MSGGFMCRVPDCGIVDEGGGFCSEHGDSWWAKQVRAAEARADALADALAAERDALARLIDESLEREKALEAAVDALRSSLEEISVPPDARSSKGEDYGCLDLHEARMIAFEALVDGDRHRAAQTMCKERITWAGATSTHVLESACPTCGANAGKQCVAQGEVEG